MELAPAAGPPTQDAASGNGNNTHKRKNVSAACIACKRKRIRCSGEPLPCVACVKSNIQCVVDLRTDQRRKYAIKQKKDSADSCQDLLIKIFRSLRRGNETQIQSLLQLIRNEAPMTEICAYIDNLIVRLREDSPSTDSAISYLMDLRSVTRQGNESDPSSDLRRGAASMASVIGFQPPIRVPAKPWTMVTDDNEFVSHLISVFFMWASTAYPSIDKDIFIRAMNSEDIANQFCSPFLVNSILSVACMFTDHPSVFADPGDPSSRGVHFLAEAVRVWNLEEGRPSLASLQAFPHLISTQVILGKDRVGILYTTQMATLKREVKAQVKRGMKQGIPAYTTTDFQQSYSLAMWAAFVIETEISIAWVKAIDIQRPNIEYPYRTEDLNSTSVWMPFPQPVPETKIAMNGLIHERFNLYSIASECIPLILSGNATDSPSPNGIILDSSEKISWALDLEVALREWHETLPVYASVHSEDDSQFASPVIDLHLAYHAFQLQLQNLILRETTIPYDSRTIAQEKVIAACQSISGLVGRLQYLTDLNYFSILLCHSTTVAAYSLLEFLSRPGIPDYYHTLILGMYSASRWWIICRGLMKMIWITITEKNLAPYLSDATLELFKRGNADTWENDNHTLYEGITYPNYAAFDDDKYAATETGELLRLFSEMQVASRSNDRQ